MFFMEYKYKVRSGISLLIGLVLVSVISMFALIVTNVVVSNIKQAGRVVDSKKAYYGAEGALEVGLLENAEHGAGYSNESDNVYGCSQQGHGDESCIEANVNIEGQVKDVVKYSGTYTNYDGYYGIPAPGTGDVGKECNPAEAVYDRQFWVKRGEDFMYVFSDPNNQNVYSGPFPPEDHPCNWNKIGVGETVSIPLYVMMPRYSVPLGVNCEDDEDDSDMVVCNPADMGIEEFILRVRTPCKGEDTQEMWNFPEMCDDGGRFYLDDSFIDDRLFKGDDLVMKWGIEGQDVSDVNNVRSVVLSSDLDKDYDTWWGSWKNFNVTNSIYESKINNQKDVDNPNQVKFALIGSCFQFAYNVVDNFGVKGSILEFLQNSGAWSGYKLNKPVLKLTVIDNLKSRVGDYNIPYLEYQVLVKYSKDIPPTNTAQIIKAEGVSGDYKVSIEGKVPQKGDIVDYVVQQ